MSDRLDKFDRWANALDTRFRVLGIPVGWDSILGLIPGVGDAITVIPAGMMIHEGYRMGARKRAIARMLGNTGLDLAFGSIPLIGDAFDFAFKSHKKNAAILRSEFERLEGASSHALQTPSQSRTRAAGTTPG
jgi:hypothetical protein